MFRADYCGDGVAWTRDGMAIDFFDSQGIKRPEDPATLPFEAAWGEDGALCPRLAAAPSGPACTEQAARAWPGALLFNRSADPP